MFLSADSRVRKVTFPFSESCARSNVADAGIFDVWCLGGAVLCSRSVVAGRTFRFWLLAGWRLIHASRVRGGSAALWA